ncbi:MAG: thymidine phosphorylase, partial [Rhodothermales bacterium]|nr:thymidine phosphorylase [Rhodothermales bacterium]
MRDEDSARRLAERLVGIGLHFGCQTVALLTRMDDPLGRAVGNWLEVEESIRCLRGEHVEEVTDLAIALASEMMVLGKVADSLEEADSMSRGLLESGAAFEKFIELVSAQGGDTAVIENPAQRGVATAIVEVAAARDQVGYVQSIDARAIGETAMRLGAGRKTVDDPVDPLAGIVVDKKRGDAVQPGECLARLHTRNTKAAGAFIDTVRQAFLVADQPAERDAVVLDRLTDGRWASAGD